MTQEPPEGREPPRAPELETRPAGTEPAGHAPEAVQSLKQAMRRARFDDAERVGVLTELRAMQIGRLELLQEALRPLLAQIPPRDVDMFDVGIMPGATPRLFIDMIGFVEMGRDARLYRLLQDTRHCRVTIAETVEIGRMVEAVTDYVARRLLERDKALAADTFGGDPRPDVSPAPRQARHASARTRPLEGSKPSTPPRGEPRAAPAGRWRRALRWSAMTFAFVIDLLGATTLFTILAVIGWFLWNRFHGQV